MEKLIRDNDPDNMQSEGIEFAVRIADDAELDTLLIDKLQEEAQEFAEGPSIQELADVLDVVQTIAKRNEWDLGQAIKDKRDRRGGFMKGIVLEDAQNHRISPP